jgi:multiple sugar transport system substrate-binding protein
LKIIRLVAVMLSIVLTASACTLTNAKKESVDIHWMIDAPSVLPSSINLDKIYRDTILSFEKLHPTIKVTLDYFPQTNDFDFLKMMKSDQSPDIIPFGFTEMETIDKNGILIDLMSLVPDSNNIDIDPKILDSIKFHEKLYALPYSFSPFVVLYNKSLFDVAHIPYPEDNWTWEQFRTISKKILPEQGSDIAYDIITLEALSASKGKSILSPNGDTFVGYLDSPEAVEALKWLNAYYHDDKTKADQYGASGSRLFFSNILGVLRDPGNSGRTFFSGVRGMILADLQSYTIYKESLGDDLGVASLPHFENGERVNPLFYQGYAISKKSKNPQAAWEFLKYLTLTNQENTGALTQNYLTTSKSIGLAIQQDTDPIKRVFANEIKYAIMPVGYINQYYYQALNQDLLTQFQDISYLSDAEIQPRLHDLAIKLDQEIKRLKTAADLKTETPAPS